MQFGPVHDTIFFYAKTKEHKLRPVFTPQSRASIAKEFRYSDDSGIYRLNEIMGPGPRTGDSGKPWRGYNPTSVGRHWAVPESIKRLLPDGASGLSLQQQLDALHEIGAIYISKEGRPKYKQRPTDGVALQDVWAFQPGTEGCLFNSNAAIDEDVRWLGSEVERLGYPTQKPVGLLERIIRSSSDVDSIVLDPFCGCGTTIHAAQKLGRHWVGIDVTHLAISLIERRLKDAFPGITFEVHGTPQDLDGARDLALRDKYQFQWWAVSLIEAQPYGGKKKGADGGIDGLIYFRSGAKTTERAIVSVKGGGVSVPMVRDLKGVLDREKAPIGVFLTLEPPTRPMEKEAASAGFYKLGERQYPRVQLITVEQALAGVKPAIPLIDTGAAFKRAPREGRGDQTTLFS